MLRLIQSDQLEVGSAPILARSRYIGLRMMKGRTSSGNRNAIVYPSMTPVGTSTNGDAPSLICLDRIPSSVSSHTWS